jgi:hypothetical protein
LHSRIIFASSSMPRLGPRHSCIYVLKLSSWKSSINCVMWMLLCSESFYLISYLNAFNYLPFENHCYMVVLNLSTLCYTRKLVSEWLFSDSIPKIFWNHCYSLIAFLETCMCCMFSFQYQLHIQHLLIQYILSECIAICMVVSSYLLSRKNLKTVIWIFQLFVKFL